MQIENGGNGGTSESTVLAFESNLGVVLPADYRKFLLAYNGGSPLPYCFDVPGWGDSLVNELYGLGLSDSRSLDRAIERRVEILSKTQTIPIGYDPGGNGIFMGVAPKNLALYALGSDAGSRHEPADRQTASNSPRLGVEDGHEEEGHAAPVGAG